MTVRELMEILVSYTDMDDVVQIEIGDNIVGIEETNLTSDPYGVVIARAAI